MLPVFALAALALAALAAVGLARLARTNKAQALVARARRLANLKLAEKIQMIHLSRLPMGGRRGITAIQAAIGLFVMVGILALVTGLTFGLTKSIAAEINTGNETYISPTFIDRINQAESFAGLGIFIGAVVGVIMIVMVLWAVVRQYLG